MNLKVERPMNLKGLVGSSVEQRPEELLRKWGISVFHAFNPLVPELNARCSL